jgi:hypothetical protein
MCKSNQNAINAEEKHKQNSVLHGFSFRIAAVLGTFVLLPRAV